MKINEKENNSIIQTCASVLSGLLPEDEEFVSLPDALLYQVEQQHHLSRVFQEAGLVVIHDVPRLPT